MAFSYVQHIYKAKVFTGIYTHFPSEEDDSVNRGLLELELEHLQLIVKDIRKGSLLLMNESFATTTEKEGSQIAEGVMEAFRESGILTIFVTHLFTYADALYKRALKDVIFYAAGRNENGERTYQISEGRPAAYGNGVDIVVK